jgi:hypothetical protein
LQGAGDGIATAEQLIARHGIQVVFMSGNPDMEKDERVGALRPLAILTKPCSPQRIHQVLLRARMDE